MANINDWKEVPVEDWKEVPVEQSTQTPEVNKSYNPLATIKNFPGSVASGLWGAINAAIHPIQTGSMIHQAGMGLGNKFERAMWGTPETYPVTSEEQTFNAMAQGLIEPYSSLKNLQRTAEEDPARILWDIGSLATGTGLAGKALQMPRLANTLTNIGAKVDPLWLMKESVAFPLSKTSLPEKLYQSSLKGMTGKKWPWEKRETVTTTGLEQGIKVGATGYEKLRGKIDDLNEQIGGVIEPAAQRGETIPTQSIIRKFNTWATDYLSESPHPLEDSKIINDMRMEIISRGNNINVGTAQKIKQNLYKELNERYGRLGTTAVEADKGYARAIKELLADAYPELTVLNSKDSALIELEKAIEPAAKRIRNRDVLGGAWMTFSPKAVVARWVGDFPEFKSALAIALHKAENLRNINKGMTAIRQGGVQTGRFTGLSPILEE